MILYVVIMTQEDKN